MPEREPKLPHKTINKPIEAESPKDKTSQSHLTSEQMDQINLSIDSGTGPELLENIHTFPTETHNEILKIVLNADQGLWLAKNLNKFKGLDESVAKLMIEKGLGEAVVENLTNFTGLDHSKIAKFLIENDMQNDRGSHWLKDIKDFDDLDASVAGLLIEKGDASTVLKNLEKFPKLEHAELANILLEKGFANVVAQYLPDFIDWNATLAEHLLIKRNNDDLVLKNLHRFAGPDQNEIARLMIKKGSGAFLSDHLSNFTKLDQNEIAKLFIQRDVRLFMSVYKKFSQVNTNELARLIIDKTIPDEIVIREMLDTFTGLNYEAIAKQLIKKNDFLNIASNLDKFPNLDQDQIALQLIVNGQSDVLIGNLHNFKALKASTAKLFIQHALDAAAFISSLDAMGLWKESFYDDFNLCIVFAGMAYDAETNIALFKQHPFLTTALEYNVRDATRLLTTFPNLDEDSQENIAKIYEIKDASGIDPRNNPEGYRKLVHAKLLEYKNNPNIAESIQSAGVSTDIWLNYSEIEDFTLGAEEDVSFSEMVKTPMTRIQETFDIYTDALKRELGTFLPQLIAYKVSLEDVSGTQAQIDGMRQALEQANVNGNEKKAQGIQKGIDSLTKRLSNPKMIAIWEKIMSEYSAVTLLQKDVVAANSDIEKLEAKERELAGAALTISERRKQVQAIKSERANLERQFKDKLEIMNQRFITFREGLSETLASAITAENANQTIQKIYSTSGEALQHYASDMKTLSDIVAPEDKRESLEGRSMSIELWNRDPDVDLYLGNFTSCCVAIDNDIHERNSPISDYLTDVGIQIITITDQKRNRPIAAAWCYIGVDGHNANALVIDNIEADTEYSIPFKSQLEEKMRSYVHAYAEAVGIKVVSQGELNNDLEVAPLETKYTKLGGYNIRAGYYLEAEPEDIEDIIDGYDDDF